MEKILRELEAAWLAGGMLKREFSSFQYCSGGSINTVLLAVSRKEKFIVKINRIDSFPGMFRLEAEGLAAINKKGAPPVPEVLTYSEVENSQYLFLEYVQPKARLQNRDEIFGAELATLHKHTFDSFGWHESNYIGSLVQHNQYKRNGIDFFVHQRIEPLAEAVFKKFQDADAERRLAALCSKLPSLLPDEPSALVHGDLWTGNRIPGTEGAWTLIDPAVHYGNRESDLAMSFLFGDFGQHFLDSYQEQYPMYQGFKERIDLWNLYPLLVHTALFGESYLGAVKQVLHKYA